ncbi:hypothetical protein CMUS01_04675 [Colletotrichum musicola]|uniref:Borealin N-terminal domain-containing protein n=1 Tax=Colletotrichum musicola TaxID=2175873 RepID=A0A8H6NMV3_9PEZI|nr:hypothetical protein CMUS01_04675 [Colletotrichum musicola]
MSQRQAIPSKAGTPTVLSSSPSKRPRIGITLEQKQAIIDNLQLESAYNGRHRWSARYLTISTVTDRARRLRAQYNQQAQTLRSRIQMRVNRVPRSLLKMTMADLVTRASEQQKRLGVTTRPPPVPEKDYPRASPHKLAPPSRPAKRLSDAMTGGDKENEQIINPKKKHRAGPATTTLSSSQILSPTSSNTRSLLRDRPSSPSKSQIGRPASSPAKQHTSVRSAVTSMAEKAKKTSRTAPQRTLASSTASSNASAPVNPSVPAPTRTRRANTVTASKAPSRPATRTGKRVSESSEGSTGTVVKKTAPPGPVATSKRTVMGTIRKGVGAATARKPAAPKSAPASTAGSTRVLRKRA